MIAVFLLLPRPDKPPECTDAMARAFGHFPPAHTRAMSTSSPTRRILRSGFVAVLLFVTFTGTTPAAGAKPDDSVRAGWVWPIAEPHPIVRPFIAPDTPYSSGHRGIDIAAPVGASVRSPADGVVHFSGFVVDRYLVSIDHDGGLISSFEPVLSTLAEGTIVRRGEQIGALQSGHCGAPCLHFGVRLHGQYISPLNYLGGISHSVLLPTRRLP